MTHFLNFSTGDFFVFVGFWGYTTDSSFWGLVGVHTLHSTLHMYRGDRFQTISFKAGAANQILMGKMTLTKTTLT